MTSLLALVLSVPASSIDGSPWVTIGEVATAAVAVASLVWTIWREVKSRRQKETHDRDAASGEYLKRSLDAFDELVHNLQTELRRTSRERDEYRESAIVIERRLTAQMASLRREVNALRQLLISHSIALPEYISE